MILFALGFTSCKKCATCKIVTATYETIPQEKCGTSSEVDDFVDGYKKQATQISTIGARAECTFD